MKFYCSACNIEGDKTALIRPSPFQAPMIKSKTCDCIANLLIEQSSTSSGDSSSISDKSNELEKHLKFPKSLHELSVVGTSASTNRAKPEAENFYNRGKQFHAEGDFASAITSLTMAIVVDPFNDLYYTSRAECLENVNLHSAALKDFIASNVLYMYNIRAWRGIVFNTYKLSKMGTAKAMLVKLKKFRDDLTEGTTGSEIEEIEDCIKQCEELIFKSTSQQCATYIGDVDLDLWHFTTDGLHRLKQQELIMVDVPTKEKMLPKGWHSRGWSQLLRLKKIDKNFRKNFVTGDILQWQHNASSTSYCALFFSVENQHQVEIIKHDLYREGYASALPAKAYAFVKLFSNKEKARDFYAKYALTYVSDVVGNAHEWRERYSRGELIAPPRDVAARPRFSFKKINTKGRKLKKSKSVDSENKRRSWLKLSF